ncbi:hypothetical protein [cyanobacterium endosymbiont of Rhopalodia gibberula]|uniref:hypothetical protein n=1 Tax=cyanobacterium endosymbiont of Rhopalodia gibberula TaxID=1763363 RepID=UPI0015590032|nr:hypothetical protein [cyanobacterium endosymbiont of Rhopalodia gibberula]
MTTTIAQIKHSPKRSVVSYKPCYSKDGYGILCYHVISLHDQGDLGRIEGSDKIPFVAM